MQIGMKSKDSLTACAGSIKKLSREVVFGGFRLRLYPPYGSLNTMSRRVGRAKRNPPSHRYINQPR